MQPRISPAIVHSPNALLFLQTTQTTNHQETITLVEAPSRPMPHVIQTLLAVVLMSQHQIRPTLTALALIDQIVKINQVSY
jgi:hypothetical protein